MSTELLINVTPRETRIALVENGVLQEIFIDRASCRGLAGNIYKGRVTRVLPGMQAAFVDVGLERAAFLHASDILRPSIRLDESDDDDRADSDEMPCDDGQEKNAAHNGKSPCPDITQLVREGQELLVQIIKDPIGTKGARLTTHISLPSRYMVYMPYNTTVGVSQRIETEAERQRLRDMVHGFLERYRQRHPDPNAEVPGADLQYRRDHHGGYIVRTAAESISDEILLSDMEFLQQMWTSIQKNCRVNPESRIVHEELPLVMRTLREMIRTEIERVRIDSAISHRRVQEFISQFIPDIATRVEHYTGDRPIFDIYGVEDELQRALERKVTLKSGGHLVLDQTEAMTTIDVNTGAFVGHRNLEETIFKTNLEAAQAIGRQLRLRNLGGIIIVDFIDMTSEDHKRQVLRTLENTLERDNTKTHISEVSSLGLVQMTRKRTRESLEHILCEPCPHCRGRGSLYTAETVCYQIFRDIMREARQFEADKLLVLASQSVVDQLLEQEADSVTQLEEFLDTPIEVQVENGYAQEQYDIVLM